MQFNQEVSWHCIGTFSGAALAPSHEKVPEELFSLAPALLAFAPPERTAAGDLVANLPGWDKPLPSKMHSGYIDVKVPGDREMHVHYIFVESESEPDTDPVLLWTNAATCTAPNLPGKGGRCGIRPPSAGQ